MKRFQSPTAAPPNPPVTRRPPRRFATSVVILALTALGCRSSPRSTSTVAAPPPDAATTTIVTLNIRHDNPGDGPDAWPNRADGLIAALAGFEADVIGLQEVLPRQADRIAGDLPEFEMLVRSRERVAGRGEAVPILWRTSHWRLDPDAHGTFWLSETPDVPGSKSWDSSLPRVTTWARLLPVSEMPDLDERRPLWIFNTHFDHRGVEARLESAKLLLDRILAWCDPTESVVLLGDFNAGPDEPPVRVLVGGDAADASMADPPLIDSWASLNGGLVENATWNGFEFIESGSRIDYVFARGLPVRSATIDRPTIGGRPISDHWPVRVVFENVRRSDAKAP